ncbi:MAG TPA: M23 family metallopeptidase [Spirochaetia bacterium]|nr:M23 family metallopeptidase [Spirochaetia bacterium]
MKRLFDALLTQKHYLTPALLFVLLTAGMFVFNLIIVDYIDGYTVLAGGKPIGLVKSKDDVTQRLALLERQIETENQIDIVFDKDLLGYTRTEATLDRFSSIASLDHNLKENLTYKCKVWVLKVDGEEVVYLRTRQEVEQLIDRLNRAFIPKVRSDDKIEDLSIHIMEDLDIQTGLAYTESIKNIDDAFNYLLWGAQERKSYSIQRGDSFYAISKKYGISFTDLITANSHLDPQNLKVGDTVYLTVPKPQVNVEVSYRHVYDQIIYPPVISIRDNSMLRTQLVVDAEGEQGKKRVYADKVFVNDKEKSIIVVKEEILKNPRVRVLRIGTRRTPDDILVARAFLAPGIGVISDYFGSPRWGGRRHIGIDIAVPENTPVYAYRAGTVQTAGWSRAGYGNLVVLEHEDGMLTYYGHMNSVAVKPGQHVEKGELIAYSGNTGISTGPHVHFEIRIDNRPINPLTYLKSH